MASMLLLLADEGTGKCHQRANQQSQGADGYCTSHRSRQSCPLCDRSTCVDAGLWHGLHIQVLEPQALQVVLGDADIVMVVVVPVVVPVVAPVEIMVLVVLHDLVDEGTPVHLIDHVCTIVCSTPHTFGKGAGGCGECSNVDSVDVAEADQGSNEANGSTDEPSLIFSALAAGQSFAAQHHD